MGGEDKNRKDTAAISNSEEKMPTDAPAIKRLSSLQKEQLELEMYTIFREIDIHDMLEQLKKLKDIKNELHELEMVLKTAKCCLQKICNKQNNLFCC